MKKKKSFYPNSKRVLMIMIIICISMLAMTFASDYSMEPLRTGAGYLVTPFEKGISYVSQWIGSFGEYFSDSKALAEENEQLRQQVAALEEENTSLMLDSEELDRLEALYEIDESYSQYDKVMARVIAKEAGNWYSSFTIDKGSNDGISENMNVIADGGLVGLVTEVGPGWAQVQSIIDDGINVSGMTMADSEPCVITGSLDEMDTGRLKFSKLIDDDNRVAVGENIVTSHISDKYLEGILIGTIASIERDSSNLSCAGYLIPAVDFSSLHEVLVITTVKESELDSQEEEASDAQ